MYTIFSFLSARSPASSSSSDRLPRPKSARLSPGLLNRGQLMPAKLQSRWIWTLPFGRWVCNSLFVGSSVFSTERPANAPAREEVSLSYFSNFSTPAQPTPTYAYGVLALLLVPIVDTKFDRIKHPQVSRATYLLTAAARPSQPGRTTLRRPCKLASP